MKTPWKEIRKIIGLNILGGGKESIEHWKEFPEQLMRHYKLQEQINLLKLGVEIPLIKAATGLSKEEVISLKTK